ncbi:hypothetical protein VTO73DRAFT_9094 [Trametes versicolor]
MPSDTGASSERSQEAALSYLTPYPFTSRKDAMIWGAVVCGIASIASKLLGELLALRGGSFAASQDIPLHKAWAIYRLLPFGSLVALCGREHYLAAMDGLRRDPGRQPARESGMSILAYTWLGSTFYGAVGLHGFEKNLLFLVGCGVGTILVGCTLWRMRSASAAVASA